MTKKANRKAHARYMREWRRKRQEKLRAVREDLTDLYINLDRRRKWFLKRIRKEEGMGTTLFQMAVDKMENL